MDIKLIILQEIVNDVTNYLCQDIDNKTVSQVCDAINECHNCPFHNRYDHDHLKNFNEAINEHKSKPPD